MSKQFIKDMIERAIKTFTQVFVAQIGFDGAMGFEDVNWLKIISISGVATLVSVMTSIASYNVGDRGTASVVKESE